MPQPFHSSDELSLRHLPDVSDSSFSFQIPGAIRGDDLLVDDGLDFFKGADVSISTAPPASPFKTTEPLFSVTPKPEKLPLLKDGSKLGSFPTLSYDHSEDRVTNLAQNKASPHPLSKVTTGVNILSKSDPNVITSSSTLLPACQGSPAAVRLSNLRVELNLLNDNLLASTSTSVNHQELPAASRPRPKGILRKSLEKKRLLISPRNNQKSIEGGISKTRCATKLSTITSRAAPDHTGPLLNQAKQNTPVSDKQVNGDHSLADSSMSSVTAGVAGRLVKYSQNLINPFGLIGSDNTLESDSACEASTSLDQQAGAVVDQDTDIPLTLSQLSPQKASPSRDPTPTPEDNVPKSSMRLPSKRPISVASNVLQKRKKIKTDTTSADVSVPKSTVVLKTRLPVTRKHPKPNPSNSGSKLGLNRSTRRKPTLTRVNGPEIKRPPVFKHEASKLDHHAGGNSKDMGIATSASSSRCSTSMRTNRQNNSNDKDTEPVNSITLSNKGKSVAFSSHGSSRATYHASQRATKPAPFDFQLDKRSAHKGKDRDQGNNKYANDDGEQRESQREKRLHSSTTIPDFQAMHAAQEAELALRKENIKPVVPLPIHWETDHRLKERQKFDEKIREKEREQERLMELRRKEREEQEEREVRELRKKAVPKAHEVPEWYREAPKKKKDNVTVGSEIGRVNE